MGRVTTNNTELSYAPETALGEIPVAANTPWTLLEPNDITSFGAEITTTPRNPISPTRQRRKGSVTDLDSSVEFEHDATYGLMEEFIPPFAFATRTNDDMTKRITAVAADNQLTVAGFPVDGRSGVGSLFVVDGLPTEANNGLFRATAAGAATRITLDGIKQESAAIGAGAKVRYAGQRQTNVTISAIGADGTASVSGISSANNWGLTVGQIIAIVPTANPGSNVFFGRVRSIAATALTFDKATITGTVNGAVDFLFGGYVQNVPATKTSGDAPLYLDRSFTIEAVWNNLANPGPGDEYEYSKGNYCSSLALNIAGQSLATATVGFIGTDTDTPTETRAVNADTKIPAPRTNALNTTADVARLRINQLDNTGMTTDFKSMTITLNNNVSPEKVVGKLEAAYTNFGNFEVDIEADAVFTSSGVIAAVRNNTTVTMDFILNNDQGAVAFDIPAMTLGLGGRNLPRDESVTLSTTAQAYGDPAFDASLMVSFIPYLP